MRLPFWSVPTAAVLTVNGPVVDPGVTVTLAGTVSAESPLLLSATTAPPAGAAWDSVTVQLLLAFAPSVGGVHWSEEMDVGAVREIVAVCELPL